MAGFAMARLADLAEVKGGKRLPANANLVINPTAHPYIRGRDIRDGKITFEDPVYVLDEDFERIKRYTVDSGDVCITIVGNIGDVGITPPSLHRASLTENAVKLVNLRKDIDALFLMYALLAPDAQSQMKLSAAGAAQPKLGIYKVNEIKVPAPALPIQRRIASILSAYDDLIENSQRRIKILESMARALYREWFVHFRFPGHENHPRVASPLGEIPEGWEVRPFSALATYVNGYPFKPAQLGADGIPVIKIKELKGGVVADTPRNSGQEIPQKYHVRDGDVLFSWSADLDVYLWSGGDGLLNQHLFTVLPADEISHAFCFHSLKEAMPRFRALSLGATMHHIKRSALDQVATVVAPKVLRQQFDALVVPMHRQLLTLTRHVANLRRTRDLLLPRLLSGQIALDELEAA
jgi:type I restriction enzyme S subunit